MILVHTSASAVGLLLPVARMKSEVGRAKEFFTVVPLKGASHFRGDFRDCNPCQELHSLSPELIRILGGSRGLSK